MFNCPIFVCCSSIHTQTKQATEARVCYGRFVHPVSFLKATHMHGLALAILCGDTSVTTTMLTKVKVVSTPCWFYHVDADDDDDDEENDVRDALTVGGDGSCSVPGFVARVVLRNIMAREHSQNLRLSYSVNNSYLLMLIRLFSKSFFMFNNTLNRYVYVSVLLAYVYKYST